VSIEADAERDLVLDVEDSENVVGGTRKKATKKATVAHKPAGHSLPPIIVGTQPSGQVVTGEAADVWPDEDCDPETPI
jgi:hypothetical protein